MVFEGVTLEELKHRTLEVVVYDEINEREKEMIGYIRLGSGQYVERWDDSSGAEVEIWQSMLNNPSTSIITSLPLRFVFNFSFYYGRDLIALIKSSAYSCKMFELELELNLKPLDNSVSRYPGNDRSLCQYILRL